MERFVKAQEGIYATALAELQAGEKETHWMWFIFPQMRGLGTSVMAYVYGITGAEEARAYLAHPILGPRLIACCEALLTHMDLTAEDILGDVDAMKLRSSMTLFAQVSESDSIFHRVLARFCDGQPDERTLALL